MRWDTLAAIILVMGIALTANLVSGARFDEPMTALLEAIRPEAPSAPRVQPTDLARL
ncbi:hypothetical protein [Roseococcus sp.]|uniref:hypothetical protein n=1 Tax=Roseococcus sp. TaxID=2109646 RepID=UPI003BABE134